jgi:trk system potassium uptake protein TrkA
MAKRYVVVGLGQFGAAVARRLAEAGREVLAVDRSLEKVEAIKEEVPHAARADCTSEEAMRALGAGEAEVAVVALGEEDFEGAVLGTAVLKSLGVRTVVVRSSSPQRGRILTLAGASRVLFPEAEMGEQLARGLLHTSLGATAALPGGYTLAEVRTPRAVWGRSLLELKLRHSHALNVVAIVRGGGPLEPQPESVLQEGDTLLVAGRSERVAALAQQGEPGR